MKKFPKIRYPGDSKTDGVLADDVVVMEKLDGANFRFAFTQEGLEVGTRNHSFDVTDPNIPKAFNHVIDYLEGLSQETKSALIGRGTFYGEAMHRHTIDYPEIDWHIPHKGSPHIPVESETPNVLIFDWYKDDEETWANWNMLEDVIGRTELELAPILEKGRPGDLDLTIPETSVFGGEPEGVVVRRFDGTVRAKKVNEDFKEQHKSSTKSKVEDTESGKFMAEWVTEERIIKTAHKLVDEGLYDELKMPMMEDLPEWALKDAIEESDVSHEWDEDTDFMSAVRSKASSKCASVLKSEMNSF